MFGESDDFPIFDESTELSPAHQFERKPDIIDLE